MTTFSVRVLYGRRQHGTEGGRRPGLRRRVHTEKPRPQGRNPLTPLLLSTCVTQATPACSARCSLLSVAAKALRLWETYTTADLGCPRTIRYDTRCCFNVRSKADVRTSAEATARKRQLKSVGLKQKGGEEGWGGERREGKGRGGKGEEG